MVRHTLISQQRVQSTAAKDCYSITILELSHQLRLASTGKGIPRNSILSSRTKMRGGTIRGLSALPASVGVTRAGSRPPHSTLHERAIDMGVSQTRLERVL